MSKPDLIAIDHDDYHASHVGRTADCGQFFLTTPFVPAIGGSAGREFVALYLFDADGRFREALIDDLGTRAELEEGRARRMLEQRLAELGEVERFGTVFGLVARPPEDEDDGWWVEVLLVFRKDMRHSRFSGACSDCGFIDFRSGFFR